MIFLMLQFAEVFLEQMCHSFSLDHFKRILANNSEKTLLAATSDKPSEGEQYHCFDALHYNKYVNKYH